MVNIKKYREIQRLARQYNAKLIVVSKLQSNEDIKTIYDLGHRNFGENRVQSLLSKKEDLPGDISWHMIGTLQKNKIKYLLPWIEFIHSIDHFELACQVNKEAKKHNRKLPVLLELKISSENTKQGFSEDELLRSIDENPWSSLENIELRGLMGMASFTNDTDTINREFRHLKELFDATSIKPYWKDSFKTLSMGMSADYTTAIQNGSNLVRIGSLIFGERNYTN